MPRRISSLRLAATAALAILSACESNRDPAPTTQTVIPKRIISISPNSTEIIGALGAADRLVAVSDFCLWPGTVADLPKVGGLFDVNLEAILRLQPDLIVLRGHNRGVEQLCESSGIALYRDRTERLNDIYTTLHEVGRLLDCEQKAAQVEKEMRDSLERIHAALHGRPRPRVFVVLARDIVSIGSVMTAAKGAFINDVITLAGGENIFGEMSAAYPSISQEAILVAQPEVILEALPEHRHSPELESKILAQWRALGTLPAVEQGRVHLLFDENVLIPSPRIVEIVRKVAGLLHPEAKLD